VEVEDTGVGIKDDAIGRLFDKFTQVYGAMGVVEWPLLKERTIIQLIGDC
jgi:hypothetical protein